MDIDDIKIICRGHEPELISENRRAAVLIPLLNIGGETHVLFEVRNRSLSQGGDICLPGGLIEEGESAIKAALRETSEELLTAGEDIDIIAPMHIIYGPGGIEVNSFAGELLNYRGKYSKSEIESVFSLPLEYFLENEPLAYNALRKTETGEDFPYELLPSGREYKWIPARKKFYFYKTSKGTIWGLTAEVIYRFILFLSAAQDEKIIK